MRTWLSFRLIGSRWWDLSRRDLIWPYVLTSYSDGCMESGLKEMSLRGSLRTAKIVSRKKEAVPSSVLAGVITKDFFFFFKNKVLGKPISMLWCLVEYISGWEPSFNYTAIGTLSKTGCQDASIATDWKLLYSHHSSVLLSFQEVKLSTELAVQS